jgi:hypothetical protein
MIPLQPLAADAHHLFASASSARNTCRRAARRCSSATTCRTSTARSSARACSVSFDSWSSKPYYEHWTLHWLLKLMKAIPISVGRDAPAALERRAAGARQRPCGLHLRGRIHQPDGQSPALQARFRAGRLGSGCADRAGVPRSRVGQHLQLQRRQAFCGSGRRAFPIR